MRKANPAYGVSKARACQHCGGKVTERYVKQVPEDAKLIDTEVELSLEEFSERARVLRRVVIGLLRQASQTGVIPCKPAIPHPAPRSRSRIPASTSRVPTRLTFPMTTPVALFFPPMEQLAVTEPQVLGRVTFGDPVIREIPDGDP